MDEKQICRLCLNVNDNETDEIDDIMRGMLEVLLLEMDLSIVENPTICKTCVGIIKRSFYFKLACVRTEKLVVSCVVTKEETELEIKDIDDDKGCMEMVVEGSFMCRFCMNRVNKNNFVLVHILMEELIYKKMLPVFMPEMDFTIVKDPIVCTNCRENLECYFLFTKNCLGIENELYECYQNSGSNRSGRIKLADVFHFLFDGNSRHLHKYAETHPMKRELTAEELLYKRSYSCDFMSTEEILNANEKVWLNNDPSESLSEIGLDNNRYPYRQNKLAQSSIRSDMDTYSQCMPTSETNQSQYRDRNESPQNNSDKCKSALCPNIVTYKKALIDKGGSEVDMYECSHCPYKSPMKCNFKRHTLVHKDVSEIEMYKCGLCTYETKYKSALKDHGLTHKDLSEVDIQLCPCCPYKTKLKGRLKKHMLVHMDASEVKMHKCNLCPFVTKYKSALREHALTHKNNSEVDIYKCPLCPHKTKWKRHLKQHMIIHQDASKLDMYKCSHCPYETKLKNNLYSHMLVHKDISEVKMYKCELCSYATKYKSTLQGHALTHKAPSEVETFKCGLCTFATKYKRSSEQHALTHKNASERRMYKCLICPYKTKWKKELKEHGRSHKDPSELEMYKCLVCSFQTRRKQHVKQHMLTHKGASELEMYKCAVCAFETKYKASLKKHVLTHSHKVLQK